MREMTFKTREDANRDALNTAFHLMVWPAVVISLLVGAIVGALVWWLT
jgi:uncharacterized membrane-anchored protein YhcB (DUF1043 family)